MVSPRILCLFVACLGISAQGVQAQTLRDLRLEAQTDTRASASLTIPLGARARSNEAKPRFDFVLETKSLAHPRSVTPLRFDANFERQKVRGAKVSFTLEQNPRLLLNDQRVATFGPRLTADEEEKEGGGGIGTVGWIAIGAGALVGVSLLFAEALEDDFEDLLDFDD